MGGKAIVGIFPDPDPEAHVVAHASQQPASHQGLRKAIGSERAQGVTNPLDRVCNPDDLRRARLLGARQAPRFCPPANLTKPKQVQRKLDTQHPKGDGRMEPLVPRRKADELVELLHLLVFVINKRPGPASKTTHYSEMFRLLPNSLASRVTFANPCLSTGRLGGSIEPTKRRYTVAAERCTRIRDAILARLIVIVSNALIFAAVRAPGRPSLADARCLLHRELGAERRVRGCVDPAQPARKIRRNRSESGRAQGLRCSESASVICVATNLTTRPTASPKIPPLAPAAT